MNKMSANTNFSFTVTSKMWFYIIYFWSKVILLPFEVKNPKGKMYRYEFYYTINKLFPSFHINPYKIALTEIKTNAGIFKVRPNTIDAACVSPAFERQDLKRLEKVVNDLLTQNKKVLFIDIGADIGTYTITLLNQFKNRNLNALSFEPSQQSYKILKENIVSNELDKRVKIVNCALGNSKGNINLYFDEYAPGSSSIIKNNVKSGKVEQVTVNTLDNIMKEYKLAYDIIVIKIDIEGYEQTALEGAIKTLQSSKVILLIEDFVNETVIEWLFQTGFEFTNKFNPYNSWWVRCKR